MDNRVLIEGIFTPTINFSMQQNAVPIIRQLFVKNETDEPIEHVDFSVAAAPAFAEVWHRYVDLLPPGERISLGTINLHISPDYLFSLTEKLAGTLELTARVDDEIAGSIITPIDLLAYDQWAGLSVMPEMLAAFVTPNHADITRVLAAAGALLEKWDGAPSFTAYQSKDPNHVRKQIAAIYGAIQQENIMYIQAPPSFELAGQRIRLVDAVLTDKMANCIELTLLFASCLEAVGLNALLVCVEGHAFVGCWLEDECFPECVQDDASLLTKRIAEGIHEICLVECTAMTAGQGIDFSAAERVAMRHLDTARFDLVVDVKRSRGSGIRPIPLRVTGDDGRTTYEKQTLRPNTTQGITAAPEAVEMLRKIGHVDSIKTSKQQIWERKLLDLSLRNTLLNFRVARNSMQLLVNDLGRLEDAVSDGEEFQIMHLPQDIITSIRDSKVFEVETGKDILDVMVETEFSNHRLRTFLSEGEIAQRITHLYRQAKLGLEENGANTLFLALGFLRWYENDISQKPRYAPLILLPVDIVRKSALKGYIVRIRDEEPQMNITLLEMLRQFFGIAITGLDPLPMDEKGVDLKRIFNVIRQAVMDKSRWDVEPLAFLGIFSFGQFIMWNDIRNRSDELQKNKVVSSLMSGKIGWQETTSFPRPELLDELFSPADLAIPTSTDSSQLTAICAASAGNSFVLHGPPGTGKSQTITNIIANMLFQGKTVLFIAEKMAALSVVEKRLSSIGLGPFALELHSNKARKRDVLNQLEETLNIGQIKRPDDYHQEADRLHALRCNLNGIMKAVHEKHPCGLSLYEIIVTCEKYGDAPDAVAIPDTLLEAFSQQTHVQWQEVLEKMVTTAQACGGVHGNPFADLRCVSYTSQLREAVQTQGAAYQDALRQLQSLAPQFASLFGIAMPRKKEEFFALGALGGVLLQGEHIPQSLYQAPALTQMEDTISIVCQCGIQRNAIAAELLNDFSEAILAFDKESAQIAWNTASTKWFLPKALVQGKVIKALKNFCKNPAMLKKQNVLSILEKIAAYKQNDHQVTANSSTFGSLFGTLWNNGATDFERLLACYLQAVQLNHAVLALCDDMAQKAALDAALSTGYFADPAAFRQFNVPMYEQYQRLLARTEAAEHELTNVAKCDFSAYNQCEDWLSRTQRCVEGWLANMDELRDWCIYLSAKEEAAGLGLLCATSALEQGMVREDELLPTFEKALHGAAAEKIIIGNDLLRDFSGTVMEANTRRYRDICDRFENLTRNELVAQLSSKIPNANGNVSDSSEIGILKRAIRSGGRGLSIRKLFDAIPNLLPRLSPCLLMSPISVAQYIDPSWPQFDLVIFDEASQLPTSEAVGAIARGKNLIVVGDPKQLPPTSFFESNHADEENPEEDLESILDDCLALSMPETYLLWHYRSRHESLIAFSNREYYDNALFTFPSPNDRVSEVLFVPVEGFYDRSKTRQNVAEAEAVVKEIQRRLSDKTLRGQSIGVVTFSSVQQTLIDDKLQEMFAKHPSLDEWNGNMAEPIFIKNLENVQGDERDIILFSVGYGPDAQGKVTLNFGPLNREGGWRRLNVAVSRARRQMIVYSTLTPEQIDLSKTRAGGVAGLRAFLDFAKNGKQALPTTTAGNGAGQDSLIDNIAKALRQSGYTVGTNIGYSSYRIDVGVMHPQRTDEYLLGILVDGEHYRNAATARDRNILQTGVLQGLGWSLHHIYAIDWMQNQKKEIEKVKAAVNAALEKPSVEPTGKESVDATIERYERIEPSTDQAEAFSVYSLCHLQTAAYPAEAFYLSENARMVMEQIAQVVEMEAPISSALLAKRIIAAWGMTRAGNRINSYIGDLCQRMQLPQTETLGMVFYWREQESPLQHVDFRVPANENDRRNIDAICKEEISNAVRHILENQVSLMRGDLKKEVYKLFGFSRIGQSMEAYIDAGIACAVEKGEALAENGRVILNDSRS